MDEVCYILTRDDFWRLQLYTSLRRLRRTMGIRLLFLGALVVCFFLFLNQLYAGNVLFSLLFMGFSFLLILICLLLLFGVFLLLMWFTISRSQGLLEKRGLNILTISEQGIQHRNEIHTTTSSWRAYRAIEEDRHNIYFVQDHPGHLFVTLLIPRRAFDNPSQAQHFIAHARSYWQKHVGQVDARRA